MTGPQIFALCWGVLAIGMGYLFARYPDVLAGIYEKQMSATKFTKGLQERHAPRSWTRVWYRISGIVLMAIGPIVIVLAIVGVLR